MTWKDACENYKKLRYLNSPVSATERRKACARNAHFNRVQMVDERTMCVPFPSCPLLADRCPLLAADRCPASLARLRTGARAGMRGT